jgi:DnaK suppressor protein
MNEIKKRLEVELNRMVERMRHMGGTATSVDTIDIIGDTIQLADEVDVSQVNEVREMAFATRSLLAERANRLAEALERLRDGSYGTCQECGEVIAPARLKAIPEVTTCVRCQDRLERMSPHVDLIDRQGGVVEDRRFHLCRDHGVIDVLAGPLFRGRRPAPQTDANTMVRTRIPNPLSGRKHRDGSEARVSRMTCGSSDGGSRRRKGS